MRICVIPTGGTIGCVGSPLAPMAADDFATALQRLVLPSLLADQPNTQLVCDTALRFDRPGGMLDSTDLRPVDWCLIAERILEIYQEYDVFVVLHGTDTMDFSGAALSFLLNVFSANGFGRAVLSKPVILTGSQLPLFLQTSNGPVLNPGSDAAVNLAGAVATARLRIPEVALFFGGKLMRANRALKVDTRRFAAFDSPHLAPLAEAGIGVWHGPARPLTGPAAPQLALDRRAARDLARVQLAAIRDQIHQHPVVILRASPLDHLRDDGVLAAMVDEAVARGVRGIVIEGYGEGNVPQGSGAMASALTRADTAGVIVAVSTAVIGGSVGMFHYAAGAWIAATGAVAALDMTPVAASVKLMILLAAARHHGWDRRTVKALFGCALAGECMATDRLLPGEALLPGMSLQADGWALENDPDAGLVLRHQDGIAGEIAGPGRLVMHDRPAFIGHDGETLWVSGQGAPGAVLVLSSDGLHLNDPTGRQGPHPVTF